MTAANHSATTDNPGPDFKSDYWAIGLARTTPAFTHFVIDPFGRGRFADNPVMPAAPGSHRLFSPRSGEYSYRPNGGEPDTWRISCSDSTLVLQTSHVAGHNQPLELTFDQKANHATLLGLMEPGIRETHLPCVLHLPDIGSVRITCDTPGVRLEYDASRSRRLPRPFVQVRFPAATAARPGVTYTLTATAIHPAWPGLTDDPIFDGFKRCALNILQVNARLQMLANNSASDPCPFTLFLYAKAAGRLPELAPGLFANDLLRMTLDRYLSGAKGYGHRGYGDSFDADSGLIPWGPCWTSLDTMPSLVIAACEYAGNSGDLTWTAANYPSIAAWAAEMMATAAEGRGLIRYPASGNYGDRPTTERHPANWWDTINFGHEDALSNALAFHACEKFSELARSLGKAADAEEFSVHAARLRAAYAPAFLNPATGVLAGWRSRDGELHDYWFTFVQGAAIAFGLLDDLTANRIMDRLLAKIGEVGFRDFSLGLPGNLVPVRRGDYWMDCSGTIPPERYGEPRLEDGSDGFQFYENGGASGCWAYFTIRALYKLGRCEEARRILLPMLRGYAEGGFQGVSHTGMMKDWRDWQGGGHGYEGMLVDNYFPLMAVEDELRSRRFP